jgi:hypothetical protein
MKIGPLRRAPTPLSGDDLIFAGRAGRRPHQDGLQNAVLRDRLGELLQFRLVEMAARLVRVAPDQLDRNFLARGRRGLVRRDGAANGGLDHDTFVQQRREAST